MRKINAKKQNRSVKGNVVLDYVKMIKANPDKPWSEILLPGDFDIIKQMVLPGSWYPMEFFQRTGVAVYKLIANEDLNLVRLMGLANGDKMFENYPGVVTKGDAYATVEKFIQIQRNFYSFHAFDFEKLGASEMLVTIYYEPDDPAFIPYVEQIFGTMGRLLELAGYPKMDFEVKEFEEPHQKKATVHVKWFE